MIKLYSGRPVDDIERTAPELQVYDFLDGLGVKYSTLTHPAAFSMEECESVRKVAEAPVFKNLFLTNRQQTQFYLLMMPAGKPFKTKYLSSQLGCARLSFASEQDMVDLLHIHPGAVSPMGLYMTKIIGFALLPTGIFRQQKGMLVILASTHPRWCSVCRLSLIHI